MGISLPPFGAGVWKIDPTSGDLMPVANNSKKLGGPSNLINKAWIGIIEWPGNLYVTPTNGALILGPSSNSSITFQTVGANRWHMNGNIFYPNDSGFQQLGTGSNEILYTYTRNVYCAGSGDLKIGPQGAGQLILVSGNSNRWLVNSSGHFYPVGDDALDLGFPFGSGRIRNAYVRDLPQTDLVQSDGGILVLGTKGNNDVYLKTNNGVKWIINAPGHFVPNANQGLNIGIISTNAVGSVYAAAYPGPSDKRIKTNVAAIENKCGLESILKLNPVTYRYTDSFDENAEESRKGKQRAGFHAQEVYNVIPESVIAGDDDPDKTLGDEGFVGWALDPQHILPYVVAAIKELNHKIDNALF